MGRSIRFRLTAWYAALTTLALVAAGAGTWWLLDRSVFVAADRSLDVHFDGLVAFIDGLERNLTVDEMRDEFREYADLSLGEVLSQVTNDDGIVLSQPAVAGWRGVVASLPPARPGARAKTTVQLSGRPFRLAAGSVRAAGHTFQAIFAAPIGPASNALSRARVWMLLSLPLVLIVSATVGYVLSGRALAPVDRITRSAQAITVRSLDRRIELPSADDELRRLAATFNEMLERLQTSVRDMARFIADASHELRTPVSLIRTTAEIALSRGRSGDEYRLALAEILQHAERMSGTVADLLALARADAGVEPRAPAPVDLRAAVLDASTPMQASAERQGVGLETHAPGPALVMGDADSLRRLVSILIDNAVRYTPAGGVVDVRVSSSPAEGGRVELTVTDDGIGIDASERPFVFDRFYRGAAARARSADGAGLGLAIARDIATRHGGGVTIEPAHPERVERPGLAVRVVFPAVNTGRV